MHTVALIIIVLVLLVWASFHVRSNPRRRKLPPGPYAFPIIGNILQLGRNPHQSLATLSKTYGPLMSLQLGSLYTVVVSSPEVAKQVLQQHDHALCSRTTCHLLETLVNLMEDRDYNLNINDIKYLFLDLFLGGSDTTTSTVEWAMTELLLNPTKMANAKNELRTVIEKNKQVEESDISRLPYLQAVIKETLRMHPAGPFLVPRKADSEVEINGYTIPKNAQIYINVWAIGKDSSIWPNPTSFEPERFLNSKIDYKGRDFALLPFGSGRRTCPGFPFADRILPLMVASLIHEFDWKLEPGVKPEDVDTTERFGIALHKAVPLMAIPIKVI